jgi:hypothetical protein
MQYVSKKLFLVYTTKYQQSKNVNKSHTVMTQTISNRGSSCSGPFCGPQVFCKTNGVFVFTLTPVIIMGQSGNRGVSGGLYNSDTL